MASSMIQRRQEAERQRNDAYRETLRRVFTAARPAPDFERALDDARAGLAGLAIRDGALWRPKLKTRDRARLRLAAARHLFARYPVPAHLERIWLDAEGFDAAETLLRKRWYVAVAGGGSLYKAGASEWLSRKEVHAFLSAPAGLSFDEASINAIAQSCTKDWALAVRVARALATRADRDDFGRDMVRFFCTNPATAEEMSDLSDYMLTRWTMDAGYSLKGRTLATLRRASHEWHRDVAAVARIEAMQQRVAAYAAEAAPAGRWPGASLPDWSWRPPAAEAKSRRDEFVMVQLTSPSDLVAESRAMHHCVWTYAEKCIGGSASIWSLRLKSGKSVSRLLTVELDRRHRAVQVRGFGNRIATTEENRVLDRWAKSAAVERI